MPARQCCISTLLYHSCCLRRCVFCLCSTEPCRQCVVTVSQLYTCNVSHLSCGRQSVMGLCPQVSDACLHHPVRVPLVCLTCTLEAALDPEAEVTQDASPTSAWMQLAFQSQIGQERVVHNALHCAVDVASCSFVFKGLPSFIYLLPPAVKCCVCALQHSTDPEYIVARALFAFLPSGA